MGIITTPPQSSYIHTLFRDQIKILTTTILILLIQKVGKKYGSVQAIILKLNYFDSTSKEKNMSYLLQDMRVTYWTMRSCISCLYNFPLIIVFPGFGLSCWSCSDGFWFQCG